MTDPRTPAGQPPRLSAQPRASHAIPVRLPNPVNEARARRARPESNAVRMVLGIAGLASASALASAMLPSILPQPAMAVTGVDTSANQQPQPSVIHVSRVVQLAPGQTLPPDATTNGLAGAAAPPAQATPRPTPRIIYQVITRQSGKP